MTAHIFFFLGDASLEGFGAPDPPFFSPTTLSCGNKKDQRIPMSGKTPFFLQNRSELIPGVRGHWTPQALRPHFLHKINPEIAHNSGKKSIFLLLCAPLGRRTGLQAGSEAALRPSKVPHRSNAGGEKVRKMRPGCRPAGQGNLRQ